MTTNWEPEEEAWLRVQNGFPPYVKVTVLEAKSTTEIQVGAARSTQPPGDPSAPWRAHVALLQQRWASVAGLVAANGARDPGTPRAPLAGASGVRRPGWRRD